MKQFNAEKAIVVIAILAILAGVAYTGYLYSIGQFGQ